MWFFPWCSSGSFSSPLSAMRTDPAPLRFCELSDGYQMRPSEHPCVRFFSAVLYGDVFPLHCSFAPMILRYPGLFACRISRFNIRPLVSGSPASFAAVPWAAWALSFLWFSIPHFCPSAGSSGGPTHTQGLTPVILKQFLSTLFS